MLLVDYHRLAVDVQGLGLMGGLDLGVEGRTVS